MVSEIDKFLSKLRDISRQSETHKLFSVSPLLLVDQASYQQGFSEMIGLQHRAEAAVAKWREKQNA